MLTSTLVPSRGARVGAGDSSSPFVIVEIFDLRLGIVKTSRLKDSFAADGELKLIVTLDLRVCRP